MQGRRVAGLLVLSVWGGLAAVPAAAVPSTKLSAQAAPAARRDPLTQPIDLRLASSQEQETTTIRTTETKVEEAGWEIDGDIFLRSTDPEPPGVLVIKNIFGWEHSKKSEGERGWLFGNDEDDEDRDEYEYEFEVEYGLVENHELIFEVPFQVGDGRIDGNGDITLGWHWRFWEEDGVWPAFAIRQYVRLPSGIDSSGVDYELRGLISKTLVEGKTRLHLNPFGKSVNGDNKEEAEPFQYGAAIGIDHRINDDLLFVTDYKYSSREEEGDNGSNHEAQFDLEWKLDDRQKITFVALVGLDGDDDGPEYGATVSYILTFGE